MFGLEYIRAALHTADGWCVDQMVLGSSRIIEPNDDHTSVLYRTYQKTVLLSHSTNKYIAEGLLSHKRACEPL